METREMKFTTLPYITLVQGQESGAPFIFIGTASHVMSIASMFWNESPYALQTDRFEEMNVIARPKERLLSENCDPDYMDEKFDNCVRLDAESNMYNSTYAHQFCEPRAFGNCTIPQVCYSNAFWGEIMPCQNQSASPIFSPLFWENCAGTFL